MLQNIEVSIAKYHDMEVFLDEMNAHINIVYR